MMITRQELLRGEATHADYYGQFSERGKAIVNYYLTGSQIKAWSNDPTTIPLHEWDSMAKINKDQFREAFAEVGDVVTLAGLVSLLKVSARQIVEEW